MHARTRIVDSPRREPLRIAGEKIHRDRVIEVLPGFKIKRHFNVNADQPLI